MNASVALGKGSLVLRRGRLMIESLGGLKDYGHAPFEHARSVRSQLSDSLRHDLDEVVCMGGV
jgi:hypothetical protein